MGGNAALSKRQEKIPERKQEGSHVEGKKSLCGRVFFVACWVASFHLAAVAQVTVTTSPAPRVAPVANPCPRFAAGGVVQQPPALFSNSGVLSVHFSYQTTKDSVGRILFCFMTPSGAENPTLHVKPGDHLVVTVTNNTPAQPLTMALNPPNCGATSMGASSMNIHYHGTNTSPTCHSDEVIKAVINSGQTFQYDILFPGDEPPGLYWYHPHIHGIAEAAVLGGASVSDRGGRDPEHSAGSFRAAAAHPDDPRPAASARSG